ncbi:MAG: RluA family pseudouridine synthase [Acidimicrobiia bacterium]|nr:RluA family pseudouridine synthase [Acidimicrobiia bacterium]
MTSFEPIELTDDHILHHDEHLVAVNKEPGWPVHATRDPSRPHLERAAAARFGPSLGVVHRLDVWTSGVVLLARTPEARRRLNALFEQRAVTKTYEAVCVGTPDPPEGTLRHHLARRREGGRDVMHSVRSGGKVAVTTYRLLGSAPVDGLLLSLMQLVPQTGRTHQLRVQAAEAGWPILGDPLYRAAVTEPALPGQCLHAVSLAFDDPWTGEQRLLSAPPPNGFDHYARRLRRPGGHARF